MTDVTKCCQVLALSLGKFMSYGGTIQGCQDHDNLQTLSGTKVNQKSKAIG